MTKLNLFPEMPKEMTPKAMIFYKSIPRLSQDSNGNVAIGALNVASR